MTLRGNDHNAVMKTKPQFLEKEFDTAICYWNPRQSDVKLKAETMMLYNQNFKR